MTSFKTTLTASFISSLFALPYPALAQIPVTDVALNATTASQLAEMVKDTAVQAKSLATEIASYAQLANTYLVAVENTVAIPAAAIAKAQSLVYRTQALATAAGAVVGPEGSMMERARMMRSVGKGAGNLPGGAVRNAEWFKEQAARQFDDNLRLLGLQEEQSEIANELLRDAEGNSAVSFGNLQATQAQTQVMTATAEQIKLSNKMLMAMFDHQLVVEAKRDAERQTISMMTQEDIEAMRERAASEVGNMDRSPTEWGQ